jgi:hypothetical protein
MVGFTSEATAMGIAIGTTIAALAVLLVVSEFRTPCSFPLSAQALPEGRVV